MTTEMESHYESISFQQEGIVFLAYRVTNTEGDEGWTFNLPQIAENNGIQFPKMEQQNLHADSDNERDELAIEMMSALIKLVTARNEANLKAQDMFIKAMPFQNVNKQALPTPPPAP